jgi:hypothetical protein
MQLSFAPFAYARPQYGLAEARMVNCYFEATPAGPNEDARLQRPGLKAAYTVGTGPIYGLFQQDGVFSGDRFAVSGAACYRETAALGYVPPDANVRFASSKSQFVVVAGGNAYCYDGTTLSQITDPDLPKVSDAVYLSGRFYYNQQDSDVWWFSDLNDATSIDGLAFAEAESEPDANVGALTINDEVWFFGRTSIEPWYQTGDANAPLQAAQGRKFDRGCAAQRSIVRLDNTAFWVGDDRIVYRAATVPQRVSIHGVEERLRRCAAVSDCGAWKATIDGHPFYVLNIPGQTTFAYDLSTDKWSEFSSFGLTNFRAQCAVSYLGSVYIGDSQGPTVWQLNPSAMDDGGDQIERLVSGVIPVEGISARCDDILFQGSRGVGLDDGSDPQIQMRYSDTSGHMWVDWRAQSLGKIGDYRRKAVWRRLGTMRSPGRLVEFRVTDPVQVVFAGFAINEARP